MAMHGRKPKSFKADGTPKKRWSAAERAAKGRGPRKSGGVRHPEREQFPRRADRDFEPRDERGYQRRDDRDFRSREDRDFRPREDRYFRRDDRYGRRDRDNRSRDERFERRDDRYGRRDERFERRDDRYGRRDDRYERRDDRRFSRRDDRDRRDERGYQRRDDRDFRSREDRDFRREDRYGRRDRDNWSRDDRFEQRGERRDQGRRGGPRQDRSRGFRSFQDQPRHHHHDRRRDDHRHETAEVGQDQMSWEATAVEVEVTAEDERSGFAELGVATPMVAALAAQGITEPFPIQRATIADAIAGRDVLGRGRTGSGKTLAFGLPLLTRLAAGDATGTPRAVILTPTRELALQIADNLSPLAAVMGLDLYLVAGGMAYGPQIKAFQRGVDVVVATPGRLIDLLEQGAVDLSQVEVAVLDEADHMSDLGFLPDVTTILDAVPEGGQRLLFSATLDGAVDKLVRRYLADPVTHEVDSGRASVTTMTHHVLHLAPHHKNQITAEIANRDGKTVIFARTQMGADRIAGQLRQAGVLAGALHGGLTQGARARILAAFKNGEVPVLVATDVAARGIHVDDVSLVLQVDPPKTHKDYLHRAGRTARAGEAGAVVSIVLPHQRKLMRRLVGQAGVNTRPLEVAPGSDELKQATGAKECLAAPIEEAEYLALIAPKPQQRRRPHGGGRRRGGFRGGRGRRNWE
ncbi:MAG: DEAD/DEAH box helicase [Propionibacteriaceae bacterium]|nr:DEAD/DEAH box helicase [Propionibacteriaceae bacterium]